MPYQMNCSNCTTRCDGKSRGKYIFMNDVEFSEHHENELINKIIAFGLYAKKTERDGYPDIEVYEAPNGPIRCFIEVKSIRRTFMAIKNCLPAANLCPSETVVLNESDLVRYINIAGQESVPVYVLWVLAERPCIVPNGQVMYFIQNIRELEKIYVNYGNMRRFRRKSGEGDVVNGQHLGVVVNYHFSLNELVPFNINNI